MKSKTIAWDGAQITKPGIYSGVPMALYHAPNICDGPSISSTGLRQIFKSSPKHFHATWAGNPNAKPIDEDTKRHFVVGRALHHLVLGEPFFAKLFCIQPEEWPDENGVLRPWHNNRKVCKEWYRLRRKEGRSPLTTKEVEQIRQMAISIGNHPLVGLLRGQIERSIFWKDKETGIWLKCRPDSIPFDSADYVDLKTTRSSHWPALVQTMQEYGYWQQAALIAEASRVVLDMPISSFTLIFVEKDAPWHTRDVRIEDEDMVRGARANRAALRRFAEGVKTGHWPGPGDGNEGNERLGLSPAARERIDQQLRYEGLADGLD